MFCRLCLKASVKVQDIFNSEMKCAELTLIESLYWIFGVEVDINDTYSKYICVPCEKVVQYVGFYRTLYQKNQLILEGKVNFQYEDDDEAQVTEWQQNSAICATNEANFCPTAKRRRQEFIKYYNEFSTSALQELIKEKYLKTNDRKIKKEPNEELFHVNEMITVLVCKYCSRIFRYKKLLDHHYNTMHKVNLSDKSIKQKKSGKKFFAKKKFIKKRNLPLEKNSHTSSNDKCSLFSNRTAKTLLFDTTNFPNLNFVKQLDKNAGDSTSNKSNTLDEYPKQLNLAEGVSERAMRNEDKISDRKVLNSDDKFQESNEKTVQINEKDKISGSKVLNSDDKFQESNETTVQINEDKISDRKVPNSDDEFQEFSNIDDALLEFDNSDDEFQDFNEATVTINEEDKISASKVLNNDDEFQEFNETTVKINEELLLNTEEEQRKTINEQYKWLNLKDFSISVDKLVDEHKINLNLISSKKKIKPKEFQDVKERIDALRQKLKTRTTPTAVEYFKMNHVNDDPDFDNLSKDDGELNERYKHLNLKHCYISVQRCTVPDETRQTTIVPQENNNTEKLEIVKQWQEQVSSAILRTRQIEKWKLLMLKRTAIITKTSADCANKQETKQVLAPYAEVEKPQILRDGHSEGNATLSTPTNESNVQDTDNYFDVNIQTVHLDHIEGADFAKRLNLKDFCIAVERCNVPEQFYTNFADPNYKESALEAVNNPESSQTSLISQFNNEDVEKTGIDRVDRLTRMDHNYSMTDHLQTKFNQESKKNYLTKQKRRTIQRREYVQRKRNTPKYRKRSKTKHELHTSKSLKSFESDHLQNLKTIELIIPKIDPLLLELGYNIFDLKYQQEVNTSGILGSTAEEISLNSDCMPKLKKETDNKMHSKNVINADEPPLLEREVEEVSWFNTMDEDVTSPAVQENSIEVIANKQKLESSSTKIYKQKLRKSRKRIHRRKTSSEESTHMAIEVEQLSDSLNLIKIGSDRNLHNREIDTCEKTKGLEGESINKNKKTITSKTKLNAVSNILEVSNHENSTDLKSIIKSRWSNITEGKINIVNKF